MLAAPRVSPMVACSIQADFSKRARLQGVAPEAPATADRGVGAEANQPMDLESEGLGSAWGSGSSRNLRPQLPLPPAKRLCRRGSRDPEACSETAPGDLSEIDLGELWTRTLIFDFHWYGHDIAEELRP
eukprot:TRINITY_DN52208_c0_g1_i1.p1 TRINITY_DN52208_c0_g1~~TRINITY_DN52208_c0_g1_i1.p1  ORF type:complete len:129 (-),score=26.32 TRINITY_DN52208_c0_g1_i1:125-511(-)